MTESSIYESRDLRCCAHRHWSASRSQTAKLNNAMLYLGGITMTTRVTSLCVTALCFLATGVRSDQAPTPTGDKTGLIPRKVLFGNPDRASARSSPDGKQLSFLAPVDGVLNVWVAPIDKPDDAKPVTQDKKRGIRSYNWAFTSQHLLYIQDKGGDENWHVYGVDLKSGETKDLTPIKGVNARIEGVSAKFPEEILIGLNDRDPKLHDVHRVTSDRDR